MTDTKGGSLLTAYAAVTIGLIAIIMVSGWCWGSLPGPGRERFHDVCLFVWAASGVLLALTQIVFAAIALRTKGSGVPKTIILAIGAAILLGIAVFVWALSQMPS